MTRKHFVDLARAFAHALAGITNPGQRAAICRAAIAVADTLAKHNARFDRARFLTACGVDASVGVQDGEAFQL